MFSLYDGKIHLIGKPPTSLNFQVNEPNNRASEDNLNQRNVVPEFPVEQNQELYGEIHVADYYNAELDDSDGQETQTDEEQDPDLSFHKKSFRSQILTGIKAPDIDRSFRVYEENPIHQDGQSIRTRNDFGEQILDSNSPKTRIFDDQNHSNLNFLKDSNDQNSMKFTRKFYDRPRSFYGNNVARHQGIGRNMIKKSLKQNPESMKYLPNSYKKRYKNSNKRNPVSQSFLVQSDVDNFFRSLSQTVNGGDYEVEEDEVPKTSSSFQEHFSSKDPKIKREEPEDKVSQGMKIGINKMLESNDSNLCSDCKDIEAKNAELKAELQREETAGELMPAYACDDWFPNNRTCWLNRNVGSTVTFVLRLAEGSKNIPIQWRKEFHVLSSKKRTIFPIDSGKVPWNMVVAKKGHEFRLSPVTESDIDSNSFSAVVISMNTKSVSGQAHHKVNFRIRVHPIEQGFLYPGEPVTLNIRRTVTLPQEAVRFRWYRESEDSDEFSNSLPSNMRKKGKDGETLVMSELRPRHSGVIACSVFTNLGIFATKQRFLINVSGSDPSRFTSSSVLAHKKRKRGIEENGMEYMQRMASQVVPEWYYERNFGQAVQKEEPQDWRSNLGQNPKYYTNIKNQAPQRNFGQAVQKEEPQDWRSNLGQNPKYYTNIKNQAPQSYGSSGFEAPEVIEEHPVSSYQYIPNESQQSAYYNSKKKADSDRQLNYQWGTQQAAAYWGDNNQGTSVEQQAQDLPQLTYSAVDSNNFQESNQQPVYESNPQNILFQSNQHFSGYSRPVIYDENVPFVSHENKKVETVETKSQFGNDQQSKPGYKIEDIYPGYNLPQYVPKPSHDIFTAGVQNGKSDSKVDTKYEETNSNVGKNILLNSDILNTNIGQSSISNKKIENSNFRSQPKVVEVIRTEEHIRPKAKIVSQQKQVSKIGTNSDQSRSRNNQNVQIEKTDLTKNLYVPPTDFNKKTTIQEHKISSNLGNGNSKVPTPEINSNNRLYYPNHPNKKVATNNLRGNQGLNMNIAIGRKSPNTNVAEVLTKLPQSTEKLTGQTNNLKVNTGQETRPANRQQQASVIGQNNGRTRLLKIQETRLETQVSASTVDDTISKFFASCTSNLHCAPAAYCIKGSGFCRCKDGYRGNGFFCWGID
ncbi:hypothetical protein JTE90_009239 [Oedothorax gibbosus]|uniref:EGF-like domain-containing protein n=1 Tax=Oedothorax gibbosus TaxID=931172 RepID=A0AAV6UQQ3_9ARAC|nr:hypothetical protein JTE90_009239 [Oedothorax gibbosus]